MDALQEFFRTVFSGEIMMTVYWCFGIGGLLFFLIILGMNGLEGVSDASGSVDSVDSVDSMDSADMTGHIDTGFADFQFISLKTILAFITVFGWGGVLWGRYGIPGFLASFICGVIAMSLTAFAVWALLRLQHSGTIHAADLIGRSGTVYLTIPAKRAGSGRVTVSLEGSTMEISAVSDEEIPTGKPVRVLEHVDGSVYLVGKI